MYKLEEYFNFLKKNFDRAKAYDVHLELARTPVSNTVNRKLQGMC